MEYELRETRPFQKWLKKVDRKVRLTVVVRLARVEKGNLATTEVSVVVSLS